MAKTKEWQQGWDKKSIKTAIYLTVKYYLNSVSDIGFKSPTTEDEADGILEIGRLFEKKDVSLTTEQLNEVLVNSKGQFGRCTLKVNKNQCITKIPLYRKKCCIFL